VRYTAGIFTKKWSMSTGVSKYGSFLLFVLTMNGTSRWGTKLNEQGKHIYGISPQDLRAIYNQMLEYSDDIEDDDPTASIEEEVEILDEAYRNAYKIAVGDMTVRELLNKADDMIFLPFDPSAPETFAMIVDDIIQYFEDNEEYEKCAKLVDAKKKFDDS
tara:strand:+ start:69 stop:548 length:480 start_codon:yes stop_codon:yes gene_type:complete